jgi:predicted PurR-regulated permease PerM
LETVPAIGPIIAAALVAVSALQLHSPAALGFMVAYAVVLRFAVDDLVVPIVLGRSISAHPVVIMLAYVLGAALFGVVGLLLAAPAVAVFRIVLQRRYAADEAEASADGGRR